jgi:hypothetical protein
MPSFLQPVYAHLRLVTYATAYAAQDLALIAALPLLERLISSGRLDVLVEQRVLIAAAEKACKESV